MTHSSPESTALGWRLVNLTALALAILGIGVLAYLVVIRLSGGETWAGLSWIVMASLPLAFVLMAASILRAIRRRRNL
ncbi:O-antigen/teichoic acid export membrane protein [Psychromicrobium silvestre]|uniref:O-antigen/teichoic acid export membrane protein n=1 Tax=Psychromicrobium silvestre TaxID=1645614 RepID=A0A7Y9LVH6_9MICC|nr:hypothetical protein [Psychromicrobium silvestre]NYE96346.1 O-antigen/teichoic acid export membrane protein [Psychromicrobium silvestre]